MSERVKGLVENSYVRLATAVGAFIFAATIGIGEIEYRTNLNRDLKDLSSHISRLEESVRKLENKIVGKTPEGFHRTDMFYYNSEIQRLNPGWKGVNPYELPGGK